MQRGSTQTILSNHKKNVDCSYVREREGERERNHFPGHYTWRWKEGVGKKSEFYEYLGEGGRGGGSGRNHSFYAWLTQRH